MMPTPESTTTIAESVPASTEATESAESGAPGARWSKWAPLTEGAITPAIIAAAAAGEHRAFEAIFAAFELPIYNYVYRIMGDPDDARDFTQDAFLKAWLALQRSDLAKTQPESMKIGAWLYRIATNVCLDVLRHRKLVKWQPWDAFLSVFHPTQVDHADVERDVLRDERRETVNEILLLLHPKYRLVLILREYQDLSYDEIAEVLHTTRAAVKSLLFRAREEMRQRLAKLPAQCDVLAPAMVSAYVPGAREHQKGIWQ